MICANGHTIPHARHLLFDTCSEGIRLGKKERCWQFPTLSEWVRNTDHTTCKILWLMHCMLDQTPAKTEYKTIYGNDSYPPFSSSNVLSKYERIRSAYYLVLYNHSCADSLIQTDLPCIGFWGWILQRDSTLMTWVRMVAFRCEFLTIKKIFSYSLCLDSSILVTAQMRSLE
jgi:hypothetical protein